VSLLRWRGRCYAFLSLMDGSRTASTDCTAKRADDKHVFIHACICICGYTLATKRIPAISKGPSCRSRIEMPNDVTLRTFGTTCIYVWHVFMYVCVRVRVCLNDVCMYVDMSLCMHTKRSRTAKIWYRMHACMCVCVCVCVHVCVRACEHPYMYACIHV
jgi:hypothetical protein